MVALTSKLGIVADCFPDPNGEPRLDRLKSANDELFKMIRSSRVFPTSGAIRLLDIGAGYKGSDFVNRYGAEFPETRIVYLDLSRNLLKELNKPNKISADAANLPFPDESFDIAYAGSIISEGVVKNNQFTRDESYRIAKEGHRVINNNGLFIFTYVIGDVQQTLDNLSEIGFRDLEHLQRINWYGGMPTDTYVALK
mgnify:CR=1 FL=1